MSVPQVDSMVAVVDLADHDKPAAPVVIREVVGDRKKHNKPRSTEPSSNEPATSMVDSLARYFVVPIALALDIVTMLIRITETTIQLTLPDVYAMWAAHTDKAIAFFYYLSNIIVIAGISIGVTASLFLAMPLLYLIEHRIEAAHKVKNRRTRKEMLTFLEAKRKRYNRYTMLAVSVPILFGISFFLSQQHIEFLKFVTAAADIAAPIIVLFVITQTEREHKDKDTQEQAIGIATDVVLGNMRNIRETATGVLRKAEAAMLKAGTEGDIEGMIDAATPHDENDRFYTIVDICKRLGIPTDRDAPERKKVYRIVYKAVHEGEASIRRDKKGRGYLVPGKLFDKLFGDYLADKQGVVVPKDSDRTADTSTAAQGQGTGGQGLDMSTGSASAA